ncbi:MAG TPA: hypothetical protein ENJ51_05760 [Leucothrix mucor]|uniref:Uncharacterized protein n=1 Tax=Leucothrix mucor TaxID=45248 RepID=A0A7V2WV31_LEUMU|nr:hypothetical protein [Leucothrix mucor]
MKNIIIGLGFLTFLVVSYFAYDLLIKKSNPCGQLFEQTSASLTTKINVLEKDTSLTIGRNRIQELSASAQQMALSLQSCCIAAQTDKISGEQFLQCQTGTTTYANRLDVIAARLATLEEAKKSEPTTIAMADNLNNQKIAPQQPVAPNTLQPRKMPTPPAMVSKSKPHSILKSKTKKEQLDLLIDEALAVSVDYQKKVAGVVK